MILCEWLRVVQYHADLPLPISAMQCFAILSVA